MKKLLIVLSIIGLLLTIVPSILVFTGDLTLQSNKNIMIVGMVLWFATASIWMKEDDV